MFLRIWVLVYSNFWKLQPDGLDLEDCSPVALATFCANLESHIVNAKLCYADVFRMLLLLQMLVLGQELHLV